jgi:hypothetical protein
VRGIYAPGKEAAVAEVSLGGAAKVPQDIGGGSMLRPAVYFVVD